MSGYGNPGSDSFSADFCSSKCDKLSSVSRFNDLFSDMGDRDYWFQFESEMRFTVDMILSGARNEDPRFLSRINVNTELNRISQSKDTGRIIKVLTNPVLSDRGKIDFDLLVKAGQNKFFCLKVQIDPDSTGDILDRSNLKIVVYSIEDVLVKFYDAEDMDLSSPSILSDEKQKIALDIWNDRVEPVWAGNVDKDVIFFLLKQITERNIEASVVSMPGQLDLGEVFRNEFIRLEKIFIISLINYAQGSEFFYALDTDFMGRFFFDDDFVNNFGIDKYLSNLASEAASGKADAVEKIDSIFNFLSFLSYKMFDLKLTLYRNISNYDISYKNLFDGFFKKTFFFAEIEPEVEGYSEKFSVFRNDVFSALTIVSHAGEFWNAFENKNYVRCTGILKAMERYPFYQQKIIDQVKVLREQGSYNASRLIAIIEDKLNMESSGNKGELSSFDLDPLLDREMLTAGTCRKVLASDEINYSYLDGVMNTVFRHLDSQPVDLFVSLSLIPEEDMDLNLKTWALIILFNASRGFDINYIFTPRKGETVNIMFYNKLFSYLEIYSDMYDSIDVDRIKKKINRFHDENSTISIHMINRKKLEEIGHFKEDSLYVTFSDGNFTDSTPLRDFVTANIIGLAQAVLLKTRRLDDSSEGEDTLPVVMEDIFRIVQKVYSTVLPKEIITKETFYSMVFEPDSEVRKEIYYSLSLPPVVRFIVEKLVDYHNSIHTFLLAA